MDRLPEEMKDLLASPTNCDCIKKQKQINKQERAIENSLIKICELQQRVKELEESGRQLNQLYKMDSDTMSIKELHQYGFPVKLVKRLGRLENLLTALRNNPIIREDVKRIDEVKVWTA